MKTDRYTKAILTLIALCLLWICLRDIPLAPTAEAASLKDGGDDVVKVQIVGIEKASFFPWEPILVKTQP